MLTPQLLASSLFVALLGLSSTSLAFDYLEHSFLTDRACLEAQNKLQGALNPNDPQLAARYLALALFCPNTWERPYCHNGYKQPEANINHLESPPYHSGDHSLTLGDLAALPDHVSRFGPVQHMDQALKPGLTSRIVEWLAEEHSSTDGVIQDVAEDACETDDLVPWQRVESEIQQGMRHFQQLGKIPDLPSDALSPLRRAPLPRGPNDPAGAYSFDNPHYLDLVLRNHHHFGTRAYASWLGFHSAARDMGDLPCSEIIHFDDDELEDFAEELPSFSSLEWDTMNPAARNQKGCKLLASLLRRRILLWAQNTTPDKTTPLQPILAKLSSTQWKQDKDTTRLLEALTTSFMSLIFEGSGIHYLQDALAGGHIRTDRAALGLEASRHDHDTDNRIGVPVHIVTRAGHSRLIAYGDSYLLGPNLSSIGHQCSWENLPQSREAVSTCLRSTQRSALVAMTTASLLDWARGGTLYRRNHPPPSGCSQGDDIDRFICRFLPTSAPTLEGLHDEGPPTPTLSQGSMPLPPPPFAYQSLLVVGGMDAAGDATQTGMRLVLLSELGAAANWMTSYHLGALITHGQGDLHQSVGEFSFMFHWRWAARFLINAGPFVHAGWKGFQTSDTSFFAGIGPSVGLSALPEGWLKLPLETSLTYRLPMTFLDGDKGATFEIEAHWIELGFGLAFQ